MFEYFFFATLTALFTIMTVVAAAGLAILAFIASLFILAFSAVLFCGFFLGAWKALQAHIEMRNIRRAVKLIKAEAKK